ncbi:MAG: rod shape-determining protein [Fimbriimonadia bacterium]|nr:rod shape-determining protein [Fimbriimonadia bacterium]
MLRLASELGIDLGTANLLVYERGRGIVLREPSVVAISEPTGKVLAVGEDARQMLGKTPGNITAIRPLIDGVIANYTITLKMLEYIFTKVLGKRRIFKPHVLVCVPSGVTDVERRAVSQAAREAGAKAVHLIEEPLAAAIGAGLPIAQPSGSMIVDIGGGTTDVAVLSLGSIVLSRSLRIGGNKLDEAITRFIRQQYNLMVGERTAEDIKIKIGSSYPLEQERQMDVRGRDMVEGLPRTITINSMEIRQALTDPINHIVMRVRSVLEETPPELASDIIERGIWLTGGGALLSGFDKLLQESTAIPVYIADDPLSCVALGTGRALEEMDAIIRASS